MIALINAKIVWKGNNERNKKKMIKNKRSALRNSKRSEKGILKNRKRLKKKGNKRK